MQHEENMAQLPVDKTLRRRSNNHIFESNRSFNHTISEVQFLLGVVHNITDINQFAAGNDNLKILPLQPPVNTALSSNKSH